MKAIQFVTNHGTQAEAEMAMEMHKSVDGEYIGGRVYENRVQSRTFPWVCQAFYVEESLIIEQDGARRVIIPDSQKSVLGIQ